MIIWLYKLLHKRNYTLGGLGIRWKNITIIIILFGALRILEKISTNLLIGLIIPIFIIYTGLFNKPYAYLINRYNLGIKRKIFKDKIYIKNEGGGLLSLTRKRDWSDGIIIDKSIYVDEEYEFNALGDSRFVLWGMKKRYSINYIKGLSEFLRKEIDDKDDLTTIKRKIMLNNLMN